MREPLTNAHGIRSGSPLRAGLALWFLVLTLDGCKANRSTADVACKKSPSQSTYQVELSRAGAWIFSIHGGAFGREVHYHHLDIAAAPRVGIRIAGQSVRVGGQPVSGGYLLNTGETIVVELLRFGEPMDVNETYVIRRRVGCDELAADIR